MTDRGERQKDTTDDYRSGWDRIWGDWVNLGQGQWALREELEADARKIDAVLNDRTGDTDFIWMKVFGNCFGPVSPDDDTVIGRDGA